MEKKTRKLAATVLEEPETWEFTCPRCGKTDRIDYYPKAKMYIHPQYADIRLQTAICNFCRALLQLSPAEEKAE